MTNLLTRFHYLKMLLVGILLGVVGIVFLMIGHQVADETQSAGWVSFVPWNEFGEIMIGAALLGIWFDHLFRKEQQAINDQRLRQIMHDHAPAVRDAVLHAFAANHDDLTRVATPDTLDGIINNSLALRLNDREFADEIWHDIKEQAIDAPERRYNAQLNVNLTPHPDKLDYFTVTVRWEYTTIPAHAIRRFVSLSDKQEYASLVEARDGTSPWYFKPDDEFDPTHRDAYELLQFSINGDEQRIKRSTRKHYQSYEVGIGVDTIKSGEPATISHTFKTVTPKSGNLLFFDIEQPTKNVSITFDYTNCGINTISAIDQFPSVRPTRIQHSPPETPTKTVHVEIDGWVFPRAGVAFVWRQDRRS